MILCNEIWAENEVGEQTEAEPDELQERKSLIMEPQQTGTTADQSETSSPSPKPIDLWGKYRLQTQKHTFTSHTEPDLNGESNVKQLKTHQSPTSLSHKSPVSDPTQHCIAEFT